jgi:hypothetical protein
MQIALLNLPPKNQRDELLCRTQDQSHPARRELQGMKSLSWERLPLEFAAIAPRGRGTPRKQLHEGRYTRRWC